MAITKPHRHSSQTSPHHAAAGAGPEVHPSYNTSMEDIANLDNLFGCASASTLANIDEACMVCQSLNSYTSSS